jgi:hypothetical protein
MKIVPKLLVPPEQAFAPMENEFDSNLQQSVLKSCQEKRPAG